MARVVFPGRISAPVLQLPMTRIEVPQVYEARVQMPYLLVQKMCLGREERSRGRKLSMWWMPVYVLSYLVFSAVAVDFWHYYLGLVG